MKPWLLRRGLGAIATALVATIILITLVHLLPGDPLTAILQDRPADPATVAALRARWGVDQSLPAAIGSFFSGLWHGDLGISLSHQQPVTRLLGARLGPTVLLGALTLLLDFAIGLSLGVWSALHPETWRARMIGGFTLLGYALPAFVIGLVLVWLGSVTFHWFPPAGLSDPLLHSDAGLARVLLDRLHHLVLPLATMVLATMAVPLRQQRAASQAVAAQPWVLAARARGISPFWIAWRHCWRPALTPIVTLLGLWLPLLVSGAVFVEAVFAWPGLGTLIAEATVARDVPVVVAAGALLIVLVQVGSFLADVLYRLVDPVQETG